MKLRALIFCLTSLALFGQAKDAGPKPRVQFATSLGSFTVELEPQAAPKTVENFLDYVTSGFYDGTTFHRVIKTFMVQGGGIAISGEEKTAGDPIVNEAKQSSEKGLKNDRGTIAMARTPLPDSATCQFFINVVNNDFLNYREGPNGAGYCVFGRVVEGMDTIDKIKDVKTMVPGDRPVEPVVITDAKVVAQVAQKGKKLAETKAESAQTTAKNPAPKK
jgi:peptidyl-prolyl cis-trans isomerase A (cyclophilin A)